MARLYASGAVIGLSPEAVKRLSMWEFTAAVNGYVAAHAGKGGATLTEDEADELFAWIESDNDNERGPGLRYEAEFGPRGFWLDGMRLRVVMPEGHSRR